MSDTPIVIVRISNGLGNQLFQYAAGKAMADRLGSQLKLDTSWFESYSESKTSRSFILGHFGLAEEIAAPSEVRLFRGTTIGGRMLKRLVSRDIRLRYRRVESREDYFDLKRLARMRGIFLHGFWQSEDFFRDRSDAVRAALADPDGGRAAGEDCVAVHVRRGDYVANASYAARYGLCSPSYFEASARLILESFPRSRFLVFSDDREWVAANIRLPGPTEYIATADDRDGYGDFKLMRTCRHFIISNSTYSWWAAWLGAYPDKIVCAPRPWLASGAGDDRIVPDRWLRVDARPQ